MNKVDLHIVSFDVPDPPDYGGVIDVHYKLKALKQLGIKVALHCFQYGRVESKNLNELAETVFYYHRKKSIFDLFSKMPFIVKSRKNYALLENLSKDNAPILFEGTHCTAFLNHPKLGGRSKWLRMHNVESVYYKTLASQTNNLIKRIYFQQESKKLIKFERSLKGLSGILCLSQFDLNYYSNFYANVSYLAVFTQELINISVGNKKEENFALYHGNLSIEENVEAVSFLVEIFKDLDLKLIVAGKSPTDNLKKELANSNNIELIDTPNESKMNQLILNAQIHCLPSFQRTGIKLKLLHSLFNGKHILVNNSMLANKDLLGLCELANSKEDWKEKVAALMKKDFTDENLNTRRQILSETYNNKKNAKILLELLAEVQ